MRLTEPLARRGPSRADHARGQPHEVAPRARHVVLRALLPARARARLRAPRRALPLPVQLLLLHGRQDVRAAAARAAEPADRGRDLELSRRMSTTRCKSSSPSAATIRSSRSSSTLGLHHEQQHQELLLTDIKHVFFTNPLGPAYREPAGAAAARPREPLHEFVPRAGGEFRDRRARRAAAFASTTRRRAIACSSSDHALGNRLVTNAEYREFIDDGGYERSAALWLADGWAQDSARAGWTRPLCWSDDGEREFTLGGWREIDPHAPVCHVSYYEADAFARWAGARLPTRSRVGACGARQRRSTATCSTPSASHPVAAWTASASEPRYAALWRRLGVDGLAATRPIPASSRSRARSASTTASSCAIKWSCAAAPAPRGREHIRASYRSFFYPHDRWQFLGFGSRRD